MLKAATRPCLEIISCWAEFHKKRLLETGPPLFKPQRPDHIHRRVSNYRSEQLPPCTPCPPIKHACDRGQNRISTVEACSLVEVRQTKQDCSSNKRDPTAEAGLQQILQNSAEEHLFRNRHQQKCHQHAGSHTHKNRQTMMKVSELQRRAQADPERKKVSAFAKAN